MAEVAGQGAQESPPLRPLDEFHRDPHYAGDLHRAAMAWARHAAGMGFPRARFAGRACRRAASLRRAAQNVSASMPSGPRQSGPAGGVGVRTLHKV
jgi:hypothetical protein